MKAAQDQFLDYAKPKIVNALPALIKFMEQKPPSDLTVDVMMQKSFLSRRSFTRKFKALTGTTFEVWYRKIRLRTACELLETTELPIETVAERSGYKSRSPSGSNSNSSSIQHRPSGEKPNVVSFRYRIFNRQTWQNGAEAPF